MMGILWPRRTIQVATAANHRALMIGDHVNIYVLSLPNTYHGQKILTVISF